MPTERQKKAFENLVENGGNKGKALLDAGYAEATAKTPQKVTESKGWEKLLKEYASDDLILSKLTEYLDLQEIVTKNNVSTGEIDVIPVGLPHKDRIKALDMLLKLKGSYAPTETKITFDGERVSDIFDD